MIVFRADAAPHIGIGDLVSLIKLSNYLKGEKLFVIKDYEASLKLVKTYNLSYLVIDKNISTKDEIEFLNSLNYKTIILEITEKSLLEYKALKNRKIAINFDGIVPNNFDFVINWNSNSLKYPQKALVGFEYAIIDKKFFQIKKENPNKILIAMGGADEFDITTKVVKFLLKNGITNLNVIVGAGYRGEVFNYITPKVNVLDMANEFKNAKIAITAGGLSSTEAITTKTPTILIATYEHQIDRCKFYEQKGVAKYIGFRDFNEKELLKYIKGFEIGKFEIKTKKVIDEIRYYC